MTEIVIKTENPLTVLRGTLAVKKHAMVYFNEKAEWLFREAGAFKNAKSLDEVMSSKATTIEELLTVKTKSTKDEK